jgi:ATP-dependent RNA helicase SUPV3L1/SUV3
VGKLVIGPDPLRPLAEAFVDEEAGADVAQKVQRRLQHFIDRKIAAGFEPLLKLKADETLTGTAKGFAYRLVEAFGILPRGDVADEVKALDQDARSALRKHGIRFGQFTIFMPLLLKPAPTRLRLVLWSLASKLDSFPEAPPPGMVTVPTLPDLPAGTYAMAGFRAAGDRAIRIDMLERLADMLRDKDSRGGFEANPDMLSITGMSLEMFAHLMQGLGYKAEKGEREKVRAAAPGDVPVPPSELPESVPEVPEPSPVEMPQDAPAEVPGEGPGDAPEEPEGPETEVFYTFTWGGRPARRERPHGQHRRADGDRPARDRSQQGKNQNDKVQNDKPGREKGQHDRGHRGKGKFGGGKTPGGKPQRDERPQKPDDRSRYQKPIDPDNPFAAALAGFKPK